jgi:hypothetical protein
VTNNCGNEVDCGSCPSGQTCGGGNPGAPNVCGCTRLTTCPGGADCGTISDGCGGTVSCGGACPSGQTCGGGNPGAPNVCGCTPKTCAVDYAGLCGPFGDGCGGVVTCGCPAPQTCGGGTPSNPVLCGCTPKTCFQLGKSCGTVDNGCGGRLNCGECPHANPVCLDNVCQACSAASVGMTCTSREGLTDQATCHADGSCCVDRGRFAGGDPGQSCVSNNCCSTVCLISGGTPLGACL